MDPTNREEGLLVLYRKNLLLLQSLTLGTSKFTSAAYNTQERTLYIKTMIGKIHRIETRKGTKKHTELEVDSCFGIMRVVTWKVPPLWIETEETIINS